MRSPTIKALCRKLAHDQQQPLHGPILPVEVIERIFVLVCEEDGATARSLSVVCKVAHSVVKYAARFDTVTLRSGTEREVRHCVSLLSEARATAATRRDWVARPIVRHLCVLKTPTDAWRLLHDSVNLLHWCYTYEDAARVNAEISAVRVRLNDAIQELFLQVAPDLETLCVLRTPGDWEDKWLFPSGVDTIRYERGFGGFPKLRDLLFVGDLWFERPQDDSPTDDEAGDGSSKDPNVPLFPALKRIHMAPCWGTKTIPFDRWTKEAPALENLRFTVSFGKEADEPWFVQFGSTISEGFSKFGGVWRPEPTGTMEFNASRLGFPNLKEAVVVITRSLVRRGNRERDRKGLARRMIERLTTPNLKAKRLEGPRLTSLFRRGDRHNATEEYLDRDWRERAADPAGDGIDLYEFSQAFRRNVTVYWANSEG